MREQHFDPHGVWRRALAGYDLHDAERYIDAVSATVGGLSREAQHLINEILWDFDIRSDEFSRVFMMASLYGDPDGSLLYSFAERDPKSAAEATRAIWAHTPGYRPSPETRARSAGARIIRAGLQ